MKNLYFGQMPFSSGTGCSFVVEHIHAVDMQGPDGMGGIWCFCKCGTKGFISKEAIAIGSYDVTWEAESEKPDGS